MVCSLSSSEMRTVTDANAQNCRGRGPSFRCRSLGMRAACRSRLVRTASLDLPHVTWMG